jgi:hypothetical protein
MIMRLPHRPRISSQYAFRVGTSRVGSLHDVCQRAPPHRLARVGGVAELKDRLWEARPLEHRLDVHAQRRGNQQRATPTAPAQGRDAGG